MTTSWTEADLVDLGGRRELEIATPRDDGGRARAVPVWVVVVADRAFVRTWHPRTNGWYGRAVASGRAWVGTARGEVEVVVTVVGDTDAAAVDHAYDAKYGVAGAASMVTDESRLSTLRLDPA